MLGLALFQMSTAFWMSGTHEVKVRVTGPLDGAQLAAAAPVSSDELDEHAVIERADKSKTARG